MTDSFQNWHAAHVNHELADKAADLAKAWAYEMAVKLQATAQTLGAILLDGVEGDYPETPARYVSVGGMILHVTVYNRAYQIRVLPVETLD